MSKLSDRVKADYDLEVGVIKDTGNLWNTGIGLALGFAVILGFDLMFREPWSKREICFAILFAIAFPFTRRAWERHEVAAQMRLQREIRVEVKVNALLGLINIQEAEEEE